MFQLDEVLEHLESLSCLPGPNQPTASEARAIVEAVDAYSDELASSEDAALQRFVTVDHEGGRWRLDYLDRESENLEELIANESALTIESALDEFFSPDQSSTDVPFSLPDPYLVVDRLEKRIAYESWKDTRLVPLILKSMRDRASNLSND